MTRRICPSSGRLVSRSRNRRGLLLAVAALTAVVGLGATWWMWTSHFTGGVEVAWADEPTCTGTSLTQDGHTIEARRGMSCVITVTVRNDGPVEVHLERAVLPYVGPDGGSVVRAAAPVDGLRPEGDALTDIDATLPLKRELGSGESWTFRTRIVFRDDGWTAAGKLWIDGWPTVRAEYLGRAFDVHADRRLEIHRRRQNPGCAM